MTAWVLGGKALKRLFLCSHYITRLFAMKIITPEKIILKNFFYFSLGQCNNFASFFPSIRVNLLFRSFSLFLLR